MSKHAYSNLNDDQLYNLCARYGEQARRWRQKFAGLLPEVYLRKLYKKKGFESIFEFAAKLAGMSKEQVSRVLNLDEKFEQTPALKQLLENGEVSVNKLARVASVVTQENQEFWAEQVKILPKSALETLVRDEKADIAEPIKPTKFVPGHKSSDYELQLSPEVKEKLFELQKKGININDFILQALQKREEEIALEKENIASEVGNQQEESRYIPIRIKNLLQKEFGKKCSVPNCFNNSEEIHHTRRFSLVKNHDPNFLAPLCRSHHVIAHSIDRKFLKLAGFALQ